MLRMKKKNISKKTTQKRAVRLQLARKWLGTYTGKNIVRGYAKHFRTDLLCAIAELSMLGIAVSEEYQEAVKRSISDRAMQNRKKKAEAQDKNAINDDRDEHFSFIAGYTSGGAAYGVSWEETAFSEPDITENLFPTFPG